MSQPPVCQRHVFSSSRHVEWAGRFNINAAASNAEQADEANGNAMEEDHREDQSAEPEEDQSAMQYGHRFVYFC